MTGTGPVCAVLSVAVLLSIAQAGKFYTFMPFSLLTKEPHNLNQRQSLKLKESVKSAKQESRIIIRLGTVRIHMPNLQSDKS